MGDKIRIVIPIHFDLLGTFLVYKSHRMKFFENLKMLKVLCERWG